MPKIPNALIGAAGVHYVAMRLSLRGLIALPTIRNTAGIDLLVSRPGGLVHASVQVKASQTRVRFWPAPKPEKCLVGPNAFYVFLRWLADKDTFEGFLVPGVAVNAQVEANLKEDAQRGLKPFCAWKLPTSSEEDARFREAWDDVDAAWLAVK